jgi:hypothetical protein
MKRRFLLATLLILLWCSAVVFVMHQLDIDKPGLALALGYLASLLLYYLLVFQGMTRS